jgi:hypothetical protein
VAPAEVHVHAVAVVRERGELGDANERTLAVRSDGVRRREKRARGARRDAGTTEGGRANRCDEASATRREKDDDERAGGAARGTSDDLPDGRAPRVLLLLIRSAAKTSRVCHFCITREDRRERGRLSRAADERRFDSDVFF